LLYPGPLCGGETGTIGCAAGVDTDVDSFSPGQATAWMPEWRQRMERLPEARSKSPAPAHGFAGQEVRQAPNGVAFLFGYFSLWPHKEKVTRRQRRTKALRSKSNKPEQEHRPRAGSYGEPRAKARASRMKSLTTIRNDALRRVIGYLFTQASCPTALWAGFAVRAASA
jgi:hypothetical protein